MGFMEKSAFTFKARSPLEVSNLSPQVSFFSERIVNVVATADVDLGLYPFQNQFGYKGGL